MTTTAIPVNGEALSISRRRMLYGALVAGALPTALLAAPYAAAGATPSEPHTDVADKPAHDPEPTDPDAAIQHHAWQLACALARKYDGLWEYDLFIEKSPDNKVILFRRTQDAPTGALQLFK